MSFEINGPRELPAIQKSHHANDGGAGNLGYFKREKKKKEEEAEDDVFESSQAKEDEEDKVSFELNSIGIRIKTFWEAMKLRNAVKKEESES